MHATGNRLSTGILGLSAALLLLLAACGEPSDQSSSDQGAVAPAAGSDQPAATPEAPKTEGTTTTQ